MDDNVSPHEFVYGPLGCQTCGRSRGAAVHIAATPPPRDDENFFGATRAELRRAREKHPDEEGVLTDAEWLTVLVEEVGECALALQDESDDDLLKELSHVAAMAARWASSIPMGRQRPPWSGR